MKEKNSKDVIVPLILLSLLISSLFFEYVNNFAEVMLPTEKIVIELSKTEDGFTRGNEIWIVDYNNSINNSLDLKSTLNQNIKNKTLEYRTASEYGYAFNMLISSGENKDEKIEIYSKRNPRNQIVFWKNTNSPIVNLTVENKTEHIDLYSNTNGGELYTYFPFKDDNTLLLIKSTIYIILLCIVYRLLSCFLKKILCFDLKKRKREFIFREYNYKYIILIFIILYIWALIQLKVGIPNYLQFGDQCYYWNLTNFIVDGKLSLNEFAKNAVCFRGYLCNLIPFLSQTIGKVLNIDPVFIFCIFTVFSATMLLGYIVPKMYFLFRNKNPKNIQIIFLVMIFTFFWNGMLTAVLMDLMGVTSFLGSVLCILIYLKTMKNRVIIPCGMLMVFSISFRSSYKLGLLGVIIILSILLIISINKTLMKKFQEKSKIFSIGTKNILSSIAILFIVVIIVSTPQIIINQEKGHLGIFPYDEEGVWTHKEFTLAEISANQVFTAGITGYPYVVTDNQISNFKIKYFENDQMLTQAQMLEMFSSNPMRTIIFIGKKIFSGFDVKTNVSYPNGYDSYSSIKEIFSFLNYLIIAIAIYNMTFFNNYKLEKITFLSVFLFLILPQTFVHVEWRYFIIGYIIIYYYFSFVFIDEIIEKKREIFTSYYIYFISIYIILSKWITVTFYV